MDVLNAEELINNPCGLSWRLIKPLRTSRSWPGRRATARSSSVDAASRGQQLPSFSGSHYALVSRVRRGVELTPKLSSTWTCPWRVDYGRAAARVQLTSVRNVISGEVGGVHAVRVCVRLHNSMLRLNSERSFSTPSHKANSNWGRCQTSGKIATVLGNVCPRAVVGV